MFLDLGGRSFRNHDLEHAFVDREGFARDAARPIRTTLVSKPLASGAHKSAGDWAR